MLCRKVMRPVLKTRQLWLDVRIVSHIQYRRMDNINYKVRRASNGSVPLESICQKSADLSIETNTTNGCESKLKISPPQQDDKVLFSDLVFYPNGRPGVQDEDPNSIARENAEYIDCIHQLAKTMAGNEETLRKLLKERNRHSIRDTIKFLERSGLPLSSVEELSIIHVAGTKGKGSTSALTESILRHYGAKTGLFTSPHLVSTNERIRIDGHPVEKKKFTQKFWKVYNALIEKREHENDMPSFFAFMTILGFHIFIAEKVDVLVMEVGLGGEHDCTNIVRNVKTVGITSLALEHTKVLGDTLQQIAWQKAGIIKPGSHVYTHVTQPECLEVIRSRANEKNAKVIKVLTTESYFNTPREEEFLENANDYLRLNGSLAIQLAYDWLRKTKGPFHQENPVNEPCMTPEVFNGLSNTHWPGRCQLVNFRNMRVHLDGAHTVESMCVCCDWFSKSIKSSAKNPKILIFNRTGDSNPKGILSVLNQTYDFDMVVFLPNLAIPEICDPSQTTHFLSAGIQENRIAVIAGLWKETCDDLHKRNNAETFKCVLDAFIAIRSRYPSHIELDVLATGSIHLLGSVISALNAFPSVEKSSQVKCEDMLEQWSKR